MSPRRPDELRKEAEKLGFKLVDTKEGTEFKKII